MLVSLSAWLQVLYPDQLGFLRVFQYLTFRAVMAAMTALLIGLAFGPFVIRKLAELKIGQPIREYGVQSHLAKRGTPTMGGALVLIGIGVSTILWFDWTNRFVWVVMLVYAVVTALYCAGMALFMYTPADSPLALGLHEQARYSASGWCAAVVLLTGMMTFVAGKTSAGWRRKYEVARRRRMA